MATIQTSKLPELMLVRGTRPDDELDFALLNMSQVRSVQFEDGVCILRFSETHTVNVGGPAGVELLLALFDRTYLSNGLEDPDFARGVRDAIGQGKK